MKQNITNVAKLLDRSLLRYVGSGILTTACCSLGTIALYEYNLLQDPAYSNIVATLAVQPLAYILHARFTFSRKLDTVKSLSRFAMFASVALVIGFLCVRIAHKSEISFVWGLVVGWFLIPVISYLVMKLWVFSSERGRDTLSIR